VKKDKKVVPEEIVTLEKILEGLLANKPARDVDLTNEQKLAVKPLMLLTMKPVIYAANVADVDLANGNGMSKKVSEYASSQGSKSVLVSAQVESELGGLSEDEKEEFLSTLGVSGENCGLKVTFFFCFFSFLQCTECIIIDIFQALVKVAYDTLGLQTYFTSGPTETRAWTIVKGMTAPQVYSSYNFLLNFTFT
jgi:hypothetical protein